MDGWIGSVTTLVGTLGGAWLGHALTLQRAEKERAARLQEQAEERAARVSEQAEERAARARELAEERTARAHERVEERIARIRDEYVSEFLATAYTNLRYLWPQSDGDPPADPKAGNPADFAVLGTKASLYVSDESEKAIQEYTRHYLGALSKVNSKEGQQVSDTLPIIESLKNRLRKELRTPSILAP